MKIPVLILNYFLLFFILLGLIHGLFIEGKEFGINRNAVIGLVVFLLVVIVNIVYVHRSHEHTKQHTVDIDM